MSGTWIIFWVIIVVSFVIFVIKKWGGNINKTFRTSKPTKVKHAVLPGTGNTNSHSTGHVVTNKKSKFWNYLSAIVAVIILIVVVLWSITFVIKTVKYIGDFFTIENKVRPKTNILPQKSLPDSIIMLQDTIKEYYYLRKGSQKVIYTRPGYNYIRHNSDGWKYYCQPQNASYFTIYGDGKPRADDVGIKYFIVKFYEVEFNMEIIFFIPKNK